MSASFDNQGTFTEPNLQAGDEIKPITAKITIEAGAGVLPIGAVIGQITANQKGVPVDSALANGAQEPYGVLIQAVDASASDVEAMVWLSAMVNEDALSFGGADTIATHRKALRQNGIFTRKNLGA